MKSVGRSIPRVDAVAKVKGAAKYVDDHFVPGMLHAKVFRSAIANGWVKRIHVDKAKALPGVVAVVTYDDVPGHTFPTAGHPYSKDPSHQDVADRNLLTRRVRLVGDEIAAVVAVDELTAQKALSLIEVEYEAYEPLLTAEAALQPGAPEIHAGTGNVLGRGGYELGDLAQALAESDRVFSDSFSTQMVAHCAMENYSAYAYMEENGRIVVVSSTQIPHICRRIVGQALGIPWGRVRVIKPYIGGGFGGKQDAVVEPLVAFLTSVVHGRPVKLEFSREESFIASRVRHPIQFKIKTGVRNDGTVLARELEVLSINGAYASHGQSIANNAGVKYRQLYMQQAIKCKTMSVYTNMPAAGAMRGYGIPQVMFALESHMDDVARELAIDPVEFRLKNIVVVGYQDPITGVKVLSNSLAECLQKGREMIRWEEKKADATRREGTKRRGLGVACFTYASGTHPVGLEVAGARIVMNEDGSVQLQVGATEIGQGSDTVFTQMVAETIGIPVSMVHILSEQDTDISPVDLGSYASRQTYITGMAVRKAAEEIKAKVLDYAWGMTDIPASAMDIVDGWLVYSHNGEKITPLSEVALDAHTDVVHCQPFTADVSNNARVNAFAYGCTFVEVEVDLLTGKVEVLELHNVHDSGKIINPQLAAGQVHGGVSMGLGYALYEQMLFDPKSGKPLIDNLLDYKLMTALDTPDIGAHFVEPYEPTGPYGNKALGEPPAITPAPAIRNAVLDATGVAFNDLPLTPQRLIARFQAEGLIAKEG
ncbi:xanthine dehydrogenase molybdenum-binding subunit XdhA [Heliobacterium gestii]|uniref:Xanthine dehydrogenase molybdenum-binding subunit XdhA n=1 Tax=Heliomicrobium gestii TaxID=2699 RepID=A0A845LD25_HELGE|nr:xanthine dehydrogenase molybdenum-binding subunit XdhA [Heliomicrobium gestii]MBM7866952.1 xanthine dehydrogenase molybdenum-binding subunit [Heliomicrobium gestii]MZP42375.1 xanthine dehydrogenase molybdenum-binding subunit XdhA [Heliomicrobium gestii]